MAAIPPRIEEHQPNPPDVETAFAGAAPDVIVEILDGVLYTQSRPARAHTNAASLLGGELHGPFRRGINGPGGWVILDEPEIHLGPRPDKVVPDLAGWRRERMPDAIGGVDAPHFYDCVPDWVCEVVSPSTEAVDRGKKMRIYRREGVAHAWILNPLSHTLEVYRLRDGVWILVDTFEGADVVRAEPFDAFELDLTVLWQS